MIPHDNHIFVFGAYVGGRISLGEFAGSGPSGPVVVDLLECPHVRSPQTLQCQEPKPKTCGGASSRGTGSLWNQRTPHPKLPQGGVQPSQPTSFSLSPRRGGSRMYDGTRPFADREGSANPTIPHHRRHTQPTSNTGIGGNGGGTKFSTSAGITGSAKSGTYSATRVSTYGSGTGIISITSPTTSTTGS